MKLEEDCYRRRNIRRMGEEKHANWNNMENGLMIGGGYCQETSIFHQQRKKNEASYGLKKKKKKKKKRSASEGGISIINKKRSPFLLLVVRKFRERERERERERVRVLERDPLCFFLSFFFASKSLSCRQIKLESIFLLFI